MPIRPDLPPVVHHPAYSADMPADHRFPMGKYAALAQVLIDEELVPEGGFSARSRRASRCWRPCMTPSTSARCSDLAVPREVERRIGLPITRSVADRARAATGGTILAARLALEHGLACNTAGGSHHAGLRAVRASAPSTTWRSPPGCCWTSRRCVRCWWWTATCTRATAPRASSRTSPRLHLLHAGGAQLSGPPGGQRPGYRAAGTGRRTGLTLSGWPTPCPP